MSPPVQPGNGNPPSVLRMVLAKRLRHLRERAGVSQEEAASATEIGVAALCRMVWGESAARPRCLRALLRHYGVSGKESEEFLRLAGKAEEPGWWHSFEDALPGWFGGYLGLEREARMLAVYEPHYVPGLLQTPDYARTLLRTGFPHETEEKIERRVALRMERRHILRREDPPSLWLVLEEAVLRRNVGGPAVMRAQLDVLLEAVGREHITLRVLPPGAGPHPAAGGHYGYLRFAEPGIPDMVYVESLTTAQYLQDSRDVEPYLEAHRRASAMAAEAVPDVGARLRELREEFA
jgi:hypothetical protein